MIKTAVALISIHEGRWLVFVTLSGNMQEARDTFGRLTRTLRTEDWSGVT